MTLKGRLGSEPPEPHKEIQYLIKVHPPVGYKSVFVIAVLNSWNPGQGKARELFWEDDECRCYGMDEVVWWIPVLEVESGIELPNPLPAP